MKIGVQKYCMMVLLLVTVLNYAFVAISAEQCVQELQSRNLEAVERNRKGESTPRPCKKVEIAL